MYMHDTQCIRKYRTFDNMQMQHRPFLSLFALNYCICACMFELTHKMF